MNKLISLCLCCLIFLMASNVKALPPLRPEKPLIDNFYISANEKLVAETIGGPTFNSVDDGKSWKLSADDQFNWVNFFNRPAYASPQNPMQQLCKPRDFGGNWGCVGVAGSVSAVDGKGNLYKCAGDHLQISSDGGKVWRKVKTWPSMPGNGMQCQLMAIQGDIFYVAGETLYKSSDHGVHWSTVNSKNTDGSIIRDERIIGLMLDKNGVLYATTVGEKAGHNYIFSSQDGEREWRRQTFGLPEKWNSFVMVRTLSDATYFLAAESDTQGQEPEIYRSVDQKPATKLNISIKPGTWVDIKNGPGNSLYLITIESIHKSNDAGKTWHMLSREGIDW